MCGFAGVLTARELVEDQLLDIVERMSGTLAHRGPDDQGAWVDPEQGVGLGFRRLAILDLSQQGHQPMASPSGRFTIVFNGEVYNHQDIARSLAEGGWRPRGRSDTEVIAAALERWGVRNAVERFNGMFAIAAWDREDRVLSLVRDPMGIKPLYYFRQGGTLGFASELRALLPCPDFRPSIDLESLNEFLRYLYVPGPATIFQGVRKLPPGHLVTLRAESAGLPPSEPFWSLEEVYEAGSRNLLTDSEEALTEELEALLRDAVRMRLQADVPLGALLSGGIDSTTVVALMQAQATQPVRTFSVGFTSGEHDESRFAAALARHLGTEHTELMLGDAEGLDLVPRLSYLFDEPLADPSQIPTFLICQVARRDVVVALTGDGGDELFGGYNRYIEGSRLIPRLAGLPRVARRMGSRLTRAASPGFWEKAYAAVAPALPVRQRERLVGQKVRKLGNLMNAGSAQEMYRSLLSAWQTPEEVLLSPAVRNQNSIDRLFSRDPAMPLLDRMMLADQGTYLPEELLMKVDRSSMAVSLEARVPILDKRVVAFSWRLPHRFKIRDRLGKRLLRNVLYRLVPRGMVDRPKVGFSVPIDEWLRGRLKDWAGDLLFSADLRADGLFHPLAVRKAWSRFQAGATDTGVALWAVVMFQAWSDQWLKKG
jgi:asparagine synthase (glutamine-hydrolysing)